MEDWTNILKVKKCLNFCFDKKLEVFITSKCWNILSGKVIITKLKYVLYQLCETRIW